MSDLAKRVVRLTKQFNEAAEIAGQYKKERDTLAGKLKAAEDLLKCIRLHLSMTLPDIDSILNVIHNYFKEQEK